MIRGNPQQTHKLVISIGNPAARQRNAKGINTGNTLRQWNWGRGNSLPFQSTICVDLRPRQLADFLQRIENPDFFVLFKREPAVEEPGII